MISITKVAGGEAYNVIPETRDHRRHRPLLQPRVAAQIEPGLARMAEGVAAGFGATAELDWRLIFAPTVNDAEQAEAYAPAAAALVGEAKVARDKPPGMGSEDFSFMLETVPGAYIHVGNGDTQPVHNAGYDFDDGIIPLGATLWARTVETKLARMTD